MNITEFLEARIFEDEKLATPRTVIISGGWPASEVPNCIGTDGRGCLDGNWMLTPPADAPAKWYRNAETEALIKAHEATHITARRKRVLAECAAKRAIIQSYRSCQYAEAEARKDMSDDAQKFGVKLVASGMGTGLELALKALAAIHHGHPDYRQEWRV